MKYFIDTEFLEGKQKERFPISLFRTETPNTIDLISIGIVAEDGREYYAISKEFNLKEAWNRWQQRTGCGDGNNIEPRKYWIRDNVLKPIFDEWKSNVNGKIVRLGLSITLNEMEFNYKNFKYCIKCIGKTNKQIAEEIIKFCKPIEGKPLMWNKQGYEIVNIGRENSYVNPTFGVDYIGKRTAPQFYAYYADYDWVAFCWLFGKMIDLPRGFPMFAFDLKQILDEKVEIKRIEWGNNAKNFDMLNHIKTLPNYPKQTNKHNALADASWNFELYKFLEKL
jgi:hypothetical protein